MDHTAGALQPDRLSQFFAAFAHARSHEDRARAQAIAQDFSRFFDDISACRRDKGQTPPKPAAPAMDAAALAAAFAQIEPPLAALQARGGVINLWEIAGLRDRELRACGALAGLWRYGFGGDVSRDFLGAYLTGCAGGIDWAAELRGGYRIQTEVNPLGDLRDRIDLLIETPLYLIGIEAKINATLGKEQLERYAAALERRAGDFRKRPLLILLAPFAAKTADVASTTWRHIAAAARHSAITHRADHGFAARTIADFGRYVSKF